MLWIYLTLRTDKDILNQLFEEYKRFEEERQIFRRNRYGNFDYGDQRSSRWGRYHQR